MFSTAYAAGKPWNDSYWQHERFNKLLAEARIERDDARRREIYYEMQVITRDEGGVAVPMYANWIDAKSKKLTHGEHLGNVLGARFGPYCRTLVVLLADGPQYWCKKREAAADVAAVFRLHHYSGRYPSATPVWYRCSPAPRCHRPDAPAPTWPGLEANIQPWNNRIGEASRRRSTMVRKAALSGGSSGGRLRHAHTVTSSVPKRLVCFSGIDRVEIRAVTLSRAWSTAMSISR